MTIIDQAKNWLTGGDPQPIPGLMKPVNANHLADQLRLSIRGQENGSHELPATSTDTLDSVEQEVIDRIMAEWLLQKEYLIKLLQAYRDRLAELNAFSEIAQLRLTASAALTKFEQAKQEMRGNLARLGEAYVKAKDELADFRIRHGLKRPARDSSGRWTTIGLLFVMIALESMMNGLFFAKGSKTGLIGGIGTAFGISLVNVATCFILGLCPARFIKWRHWLVRLLSFVVTVTGLVGILFLHLFTGHFRDAAVSSEVHAFATASAKVFAEPLHLTDISSWYLFGLGVLFGLFSSWKGYRHDDPYPFYGDTFRRERDAAKQYDAEHYQFFGALEEVRDDTIKRFSNGITNIPQYVAKSQQVRAAQSALVEAFRIYEQNIVRTANRLLGIYREANRSRRQTREPRHFSAQWTLPESALVGPAIPLLTTEATDRIVTNVDVTLSELRDLSDQVLRTYDTLLAAIEHPSDMMKFKDGRHGP